MWNINQEVDTRKHAVKIFTFLVLNRAAKTIGIGRRYT
jgi:hypothetical protein